MIDPYIHAQQLAERDQLLVKVSSLDSKLVRTQCRIETLFDAIKHGDQAHQDWLKQAIREHFGELYPNYMKPIT